jgi:hypothetical protein
MLRDVAAGAEPDTIMFSGMLQKPYQPNRLGGSTNQPVVKVDRQHLRMLDALFIQQVKSIHHIARETVGDPKAGVAVEAYPDHFYRSANNRFPRKTPIDRGPAHRRERGVLPSKMRMPAER